MRIIAVSNLVFTLALAGTLAGCGGYRKAPRDIGGLPGGDTVERAQPLRLVPGPISDACLASDREARSRQVCGCIQAIANDTLSRSDQRLAASFYADPHRAQEIRQSDRETHERFWLAYKDYAEIAAATCG